MSNLISYLVNKPLSWIGLEMDTLGQGEEIQMELPKFHTTQLAEYHPKWPPHGGRPITH